MLRHDISGFDDWKITASSTTPSAKIRVPADRLWGAQTQRSLENFRISGERMPMELIRALALVKRSCGASLT